MNADDLYAVIFEDNPDTDHLRQQHLPSHLAFLTTHADRFRAAGPLVEPDSGAPAGGLWLVRGESRQFVEALVREDPFFPTGLRKSYRILHWRQVFSTKA